MSIFKIIPVFLLILLNYCLYSQKISYQFKAGTAINSGIGHNPFSEFERYAHDKPADPLLYYNASLKIKYASPYLSAGVAFKTSRFFEWQMALSYSQYRQSIYYYSNQTTYLYYSSGYGSSVPNHKTVSIAYGLMVYNIFRYELAPTLRLGPVKIMFGLLNLSYIIPKANNLKGSKNDYDVIPSKTKYITNQYTGSTEVSDSLDILRNSEDIHPTYSFKKQLKNAVSFGLEGEIKIKSKIYLLGGKVVYSRHLNYYNHPDMLNYTQFLLYTGMQIPAKKQKKPVPVETK